jgi:peroxiredoxin
MKRIQLFLVLFFVVLAGKSTAQTSSIAAVGGRAPVFSLKDVTGKTRALEDFRGRFVVISFISAKCPVSNDYNGRLRALASEYGSRNVAFVGINSNSDEPVSLIKQHSERNGLRFPILKDTDNSIADAYGAVRTPEIFVVDGEGIVRYHGRIDNARNVQNVRRNDLRSALDELIGRKPVSIPDTKAFGCLITRANGPVRLMKPAEFPKLLSESKGKVLVVNFWATWCGPCVAEFPEFVAIDQKYRAKGVRVVGISADELSDIDQKVIPFIREQKVKFEIAVQAVEDPQEMIDVVDKQWSGALPATLVYDRAGKRVFVRYGIIDRDILVAAIEKALKN